MCKSYIRQGACAQDVKRTLSHKVKKTISVKMSKGPELTFLHMRQTNDR